MTGPITHTLFQLGHVYLTPGALDFFEQEEESPIAYLQRHAIGDFDDLTPFDYEQKVLALSHEDGIFSVYYTPNQQILYIITEAD